MNKNLVVESVQALTFFSLLLDPGGDNLMPVHILRRDDQQLSHAAQPPGYSVSQFSQTNQSRRRIYWMKKFGAHVRFT